MSSAISRIVRCALTLSVAASVTAPVLAQQTHLVWAGPCTLVGLRDFAAAHLPRPDQLGAVTLKPQEQCHAVYGAGQMPAVIAIQYGPPFQGMKFSQQLQMCRSLTPPCEDLRGVGTQAYYQRSGRAIGPGSTQAVFASVHGNVLSVQAVGVTVPIAKGNIIALARGIAQRLR